MQQARWNAPRECVEQQRFDPESLTNASGHQDTTSQRDCRWSETWGRFIGWMSVCLLNASNRGGPCEPLKPHIASQHQEMFDSHDKWQVACNACIILALVLRWGVLKATSPVATVQVETHIVQPNFIQTFDRVWFYIHKHETPCKVCSSI